MDNGRFFQLKGKLDSLSEKLETKQTVLDRLRKDVYYGMDTNPDTNKPKDERLAINAFANWKETLFEVEQLQSEIKQTEKLLG